MKNFKKSKRLFIGLLIIGVLLTVESIVMKYAMPAQSSTVFGYSLYVGIALAAVGLIGIIAVCVKEKKNAQTHEPQETLREQALNAEKGDAQTTEGDGRVTGVVALSGGDGWRIKTFVVLTAVYAVILLAALIGYFTGFGMREDDSVTICKAICLAYALITPSYFAYLGFANPFRLPKAASVAIAVFGVVAMVLCFVIGLVSISILPEVENGFWQFVLNIFIYLALACAVVGYGLIYGLLCKGAPSVWYLGFGVGMTVLFPVVAALVAAFFVICFLIGAIKWILSSLGVIAGDTAFGEGFISGWTGKIAHKNAYTYTDEHGYSHTVYSDNGVDFYNSDGSYAGHSGDGGKHIS